MMAYATLLSTPDYLPGVLALQESLRRVGAGYRLVAGISADLAPSIKRQLEQAGVEVRRLAPSLAISQSLVEGNGHWGHTFDKIQLFGLEEFNKLVYVDSDMMVLDNVDDLFDRPHMAGVAAGQLVHPDWIRINGGLMVIEPQAQLPEKIFAKLAQAQQEAAAAGNQAIGDQDLLNAYYPAWGSTPALQIEQGYNVFQCHLDAYIEKHGYCLPDSVPADGPAVKIVHFIGPRKPWMKGAAIRHYWKVLSRGRSAKWENRLFSSYKRLLAGVSPAGWRNIRQNRLD
jgi:glycogenin glucosyltransferase